MTTQAQAIVDSNMAVLQEWFEGQASCGHFDGTSYQLYLDLTDNTLLIHHEASDQSWLQRDDGSLIQIERHSGFADISEEERYTDGCDLNDYGWGEYQDEIVANIAERLSQIEFVAAQTA